MYGSRFSYIDCLCHSTTIILVMAIYRPSRMMMVYSKPSIRFTLPVAVTVNAHLFLVRHEIGDLYGRTIWEGIRQKTFFSSKAARASSLSFFFQHHI